MKQREYQTTEFWAMLTGVVLYLADRHLAGGLLDGVPPDQVLTEARAQVLAIAAQLRQATGSESGLILYAAGAVYALRKVEKIVALWRRPVEPAAER